MGNVIAPPSATDTVVLSLLNMFSDPEGAKKAIAAYNDARVAAETAMAKSTAISSENAKETERLAALRTELEDRDAKLTEAEAQLASDRSTHAVAVSDHQAAVRAHESAVKQANTDASRRDAELGHREHAVSLREATVEEKHNAAEALRLKHQTALDRMNAAMAHT